VDDRRRPDDQAPPRDLDAGAYIGSEPELASETLPGGVQDKDERVAANASQPGETGLDGLDESSSDGEGRNR
jgi:hypothetical protein